MRTDDIFKIVEHEIDRSDNSEDDSISNLMQYLDISRELAEYIFFIHQEMQELRKDK